MSTIITHADIEKYLTRERSTGEFKQVHEAWVANTVSNAVSWYTTAPESPLFKSIRQYTDSVSTTPTTT
jgi:hypothetical protein